MYVIVVGAGDIGRPVIGMATRNEHEVVVVEHDPDAADAVAREFDCLVLNDDATKAETLRDAGADRADAIITTTEVDATNIMIMMLADDLGIPSRVSVVHDEQHMSLFRRTGANVIENPQHLIAEYLFRAVQRPSIKDAMHLAGDAEVFEITVTQDAPIANKTLQTADAEGLLGDDEVLVVAVERHDDVVTPKGDTVIKPGDLVTVFSKRGFDVDVTERFAPQMLSP